jgi:outer membrane receptor protein involved in Fe transport
MDYFSYKLEDTIGTVGPSYILGACYYSSPANRSRCDKVERDSNNLIQNIYATTTNIGQVKNDGVDVQVDYGFDTGFGRVDLAFDYTKLLSYDLISPTSDGQGTSTTDCIDIYDCGVVIDGKWILDAFWTMDQYSARLRFNGYPSFEECDGACSSESSVRRDIEMVTYVTAAGSYDFQQGTKVNLSISNLLNEEPPRIFNAFYSAADESYDFMGRYINLTVTHQF